MKNRNPDKMIASEMEEINSVSQDNNALQEFWEKRYAETYHDLLESKNEMGRYGIITEYLRRVIRQGKVLDVGCGTGLIAELLDLEQIKYTGIDIATEAIQKAKEKPYAPKCRFFNIRFEEYQPEKHFDAIIANEILYYVDPGKFFEWCNQSLKPQGHLIVSVFDFDAGRKLLPEIRNKLYNLFETSVYNPESNLQWNILAGKFKRK